MQKDDVDDGELLLQGASRGSTAECEERNEGW